MASSGLDLVLKTFMGFSEVLRAWACAHRLPRSFATTGGLAPFLQASDGLVPFLRVSGGVSRPQTGSRLSCRLLAGFLPSRGKGSATINGLAPFPRAPAGSAAADEFRQFLRASNELLRGPVSIGKSRPLLWTSSDSNGLKPNSSVFERSIGPFLRALGLSTQV